MDRHVKDPFVNLALGCGLKSRSSIKLLEAHQKFSQNLKKRKGNNHHRGQPYQNEPQLQKMKMIDAGFNVIDLGCNPGGWTQISHAIVGPYGNVFGIDLLPMDMKGIYNYELPFDVHAFPDSKRIQNPWNNLGAADFDIKQFLKHNNTNNRKAYRLNRFENIPINYTNNNDKLSSSIALGSNKVITHRDIYTNGSIEDANGNVNTPADNIIFIEGDFFSDTVKEEVVNKFQERIIEMKSKIGEAYTGQNTLEIDVILSDMAPNMTGDFMTDHKRSINICLEVVDFMKETLTLKSHGCGFIKFFDGKDAQKHLIKYCEKLFHEVKLFKPKASRKDSPEKYLFIRHLRD